MAQIYDMDIECDTMPLIAKATTIPIEAYLHQMQHVLNSTLIELSDLQKSHRTLQSRVLHMHTNSSMKKVREDEPSFVV